MASESTTWRGKCREIQKNLRLLSFCCDKKVMGKRKSSYRLQKRAKRFFGQPEAATAVPADESEAESSDGEALVSASKRKVGLGIPEWITVSSSSSSDSASSSSSSEEPDSESDSDASEPDAEVERDRVGGEKRSGYRLVDLECLQALISEACVCKICGVESLIVKEGSRAGLASSVSLPCSNTDCATLSSHSLVPKTNQYYSDANRRSVLAARFIGRGQAGLRKFCGILNLPPPVSKSAFQRHQRVLQAVSRSVAQSSMEQAALEVRQVNASKDIEEYITAVTFDGSWMKRGFTSLHGVFTCIDWEVGLVLDLHVSSKHCYSCKRWAELREHQKISADEYGAWKATHAPACSVNTTCSAPGMEAEAAVVLWQRSVAQNNLQYHVFIGDGDSKGFSAVKDAQPYGPDVTITKEECVGHVQKRVGSSLRSLKKSLKGQKLDDGKPVSGQGRLTDQMIDTLQTYYGNARRSHPSDLQSMARAILASFCHRASTDGNPMHQFCPPGPDSWCGWQLVQARKIPEYKHDNVLPAAVMNAIKPTYIRLTETSLLERCLRGATQNQNEAFNGLI